MAAIIAAIITIIALETAESESLSFKGRQPSPDTTCDCELTDIVVDVISSSNSCHYHNYSVGKWEKY